MPVKERIEALQKATQEAEDQPTEGLSKALLVSNIEQIMDELNSYVEGSKLTKEIIDDGNKMYIELLWPLNKNNENGRIVVSVRENSMKFIGDLPQFIELHNGDFELTGRVEDSVAQTFLHPSIVSKQK